MFGENKTFEEDEVDNEGRSNENIIAVPLTVQKYL